MTDRQSPCLLAPQVGEFIGSRLRAILHGAEVAA